MSHMLYMYMYELCVSMIIPNISSTFPTVNQSLCNICPSPFGFCLLYCVVYPLSVVCERTLSLLVEFLELFLLRFCILCGKKEIPQIREDQAKTLSLYWASSWANCSSIYLLEEQKKTFVMDPPFINKDSF